MKRAVINCFLKLSCRNSLLCATFIKRFSNCSKIQLLNILKLTWLGQKIFVIKIEIKITVSFKMVGVYMHSCFYSCLTVAAIVYERLLRSSFPINEYFMVYMLWAFLNTNSWRIDYYSLVELPVKNNPITRPNFWSMIDMFLILYTSPLSSFIRYLVLFICRFRSRANEVHQWLFHIFACSLLAFRKQINISSYFEVALLFSRNVPVRVYYISKVGMSWCNRSH